MGNGILDQSVSCDAVLAKDLQVFQKSKSVQLAWLQSITQDNYEQSKQAGDASYYGYGLFDGDYDSFNSKRSTLLHDEQFNMSDVESRQLLISQSSGAAVKAWRDCVISKIGEASLMCWFENATSRSGTLFIRWKPSPEALELKGVEVSLMGGKDKEGRSSFTLPDFAGEKSILIVRDAKNASVSGTVNGNAGTGAFAADIALPALPEPASTLQKSIDVGWHTSADLTLGPYDKDATARVTVSCSAIGTHPDGVFWYTLAVPGENWSSGSLGLIEGAGPRAESHSKPVRIPKGSAISLNATTGNYHADALDLRIDALVSLG